MTASLPIGVLSGGGEQCEETVALAAALEQVGVSATCLRWDDPAVDWDGFGIVLLHDLPGARLPEPFVEWARARPNLRNPIDLVEWNLDKHYLAHLEQRGVRTVPTQWLEPDRDWSARALHTRLPALGEYVIKPACGSGMDQIARYTAEDAAMRRTAIDHALTLLGRGVSVMVQRYEPAIESRGEVSLVYIDGIYSHAAVREAQLSGPERTAPTPLSSYRATSAEIDLGSAALSMMSEMVEGWRGRAPLFARIDVVHAADGAPQLLELDVAEAHLAIETDPIAAARVAAALARHL